MKKVILTILIAMAFLFTTVHAFAAEEPIEGPSVIQKQYDKILTLSNILTLYTSEFGDPEVISENYVGYGDIPGLYTITIGVATYTKEVSIRVMQTLGDVIAVTDDDVIYVYKDTTLTNNEIINTFINAKQLLIDSQSSVVVITNQYDDNPNTPGIYLFEFRILSTNGSEETYSTYIKVSPENQIVPDMEIEGPVTSSFWEVVTDNIVIVFLVCLIVVIFIISKIRKKRGKH